VKVGILALQGAFAKHAEVLRGLGVEPVEVRTSSDLDVDAVVLPGGESTTMSMLLDSSGLREPIAELLRDGVAVLGTCAGLILLAAEVLDGRADQRGFAVLDCAVRRNAYGRQNESFEAELQVADSGEPVRAMRGVFIRAPRIERVGADVEVLAEHDGAPVLVAQGAVLGATFHPELSGSTAVHELFLARAEAGMGRGHTNGPSTGDEREQT
jgi:5'-phosphate synthase pdxT subunit